MTDHLHAAGQNQEDFQIESEEKPSNEAAETAADRALNEARAAVRGAKEQVKVLEQEALDE